MVSQNNDSPTLPENIFQIYKRVIKDLNSDTMLDSSAMYKIIHIDDKKETASFDVTYVTQCSWNKLDLINNVIDAWQGPVSVAVFAEFQHIEQILWKLALAAYCYRFKDVYLNLVVPVGDTYISNNTFVIEIIERMNESRVCQPKDAVGHETLMNYNWAVPYPVNVLRNVAKNRSTTDFILVADIDMLPNKDLRKNFLRYVWSRKQYPKKVIFVVPAFEMRSEIKIPQTKLEVISELRKGNVRPFYFEPCSKCHSLTNYQKWFSYPSIPGTRALYKVNWTHPWEPFYISHRDVPNYDERFKQYGYNRVGQICQLYLEGYIFLVLDNVFLIHHGFKSNEGFHATKQLEMESNRKLYDKFKQEMKVKYRTTNRDCESTRKT